MKERSGRLVRPVHYRSVLKVLPSPVVAVCAVDPETGSPQGVLVRSFRALSEHPPLVSFSVGRSSRTWPLLAAAGRFSVSVLGAGQRMVVRSFECRGEEKFRWVRWQMAGAGPRIDGAVAWLDCRITRVVDGGDHLMVIAEPVALVAGPGVPMGSAGGAFC